MDDFAGGFAPGTGDLFRLIFSGWIGAFLIMGTTILAARWLVNWQMRRIEKITGRKVGEAAEADKASSAKAGREEG
jgi:hypothetical protein